MGHLWYKGMSSNNAQHDTPFQMFVYCHFIFRNLKNRREQKRASPQEMFEPRRCIAHTWSMYLRLADVIRWWLLFLLYLYPFSSSLIVMATSDTTNRNSHHTNQYFTLCYVPMFENDWPFLQKGKSLKKNCGCLTLS